MAAAAGYSDIDNFIQNQKAKLQQERHLIADDQDERVGRKQWQRPGDTNIAEEQQQSRTDNTPRRPMVDYRKWNQSFQQEKQKDYNEFVHKPKLKKTATPPQSGMKFGEYEDFKKQMDKYRKEEYRQQLEKQQYEQAKQNAIKIRLVEDGGQREQEETARITQDQDIRHKIQKQRKDHRDKFVEEKKFREFEKMLAMNRENGVKLPELEDEYGTDSENEQLDDPSNWNQEFLSPRRDPVVDIDVEKFHQDMKQDEQTGLKIGENESRRKKLNEERHREYNEMMKQRNEPITNRQWVDNKDDKSGLPLSDDSKKREQMALQRNREYNEMLKKQEQAQKYKKTNESSSVPFGQYEDKRKKLLEERQREYKKLQEKKQEDDKKRVEARLPPKPSTPGGMFSKLGKHEEERNKLNEKRKIEYNQLLAEGSPARRGSDTRTTPPERVDVQDQDRGRDALGRDRDYQDRGRERNVDRDRNYQDRGRDYQDIDRNYQDRGRDFQDREYQDRVRDAPNRNRDFQDQDTGRDFQDRNYQQTDRTLERDYQISEKDERVGINGLRNHDSADLKKQKARNEEYNEFLRQKREKEKHRFDDKKAKSSGRRNERPSSEPDRQRKNKEDIYASLPGINYNGSAEKGRQTEKPPPGPRKGWQTPNYEEILDKKRREEASYRRDDPQIERGMRAYASEGALDSIDVDDRRYKKLDQIYDDRKVKFRDQRSKQGILDDDNWLNHGRDREKEEEYRELSERPRQEPPQQTPRRAPDQDTAMATKYFATLPVGLAKGQDDRDSAKRRRKEKYRDELQLQMREKQAATRREKLEDLQVNASGLLDPEKTSHRLQKLGDPDITPRRNIRSPEVKPYHTKFDLSPRGGRGGQLDGGYGGGGFTGGERGRTRERRYGGGGGGGYDGYDGGILDRGFDGLLEPRRGRGTRGPPAGLQYQPSTYVTAGGQGGLNPGLTAIDDAYHFYAMKNPLEPDPSVVPSLVLDGGGGGGGGGYYGRSSPRVTFDDRPRRDNTQEPQSSRLRDRSRERISPYQFSGDDDGRSRSRSEQASYQNELDRQIQEKKLKKMREKEEQMRYEQKLDDDIKNYNPFGRGGGGAPNKDQYGNVIADLRKMRSGQYSARSPPPRESPRLRPPISPKDDLIGPPPTQIDASGEQTHARGGHGIFGQPRTDAEKDVAERYKDDLKRQIEEKRRLEQLEREREKIEEEKENRRLEEQRKRIQHEYEEEVRKKREKEEEVRRKNEEMRLEAEERKRDAERKKRDDAENRRKQREDKENTPRPIEPRGSSPPVPALKSNLATADGQPSNSEDVRGNSPPIPALRKAETENKAPEPLARANSSDVLKELANMRQQLQSERRRVENALESQRNEPTVFDPRMVPRPQPKEVDVFERAKIGAPTVPVRTADNANAKNLQEFNELKYKNDTESRKALRSMFPEAPTTNSALDSQQNALLRHQEDTLNSLKDRRTGVPHLATPTRQGTVSPRSLLQSNSAFIDVDGLNDFPDDFEDLPKRNESARYRRRERITVSPRPESQPLNPLGSTTSLDVDHIQRKNDARLRRLHQLNTDEVSLADPDDILDRFMAKQRHYRPPSGQTLQDDTWLRPTSKLI